MTLLGKCWQITFQLFFLNVIIWKGAEKINGTETTLQTGVKIVEKLKTNKALKSYTHDVFRFHISLQNNSGKKSLSSCFLLPVFPLCNFVKSDFYLQVTSGVKYWECLLNFLL